MRCIHHTSFWFATAASTLFGTAICLPFWLGRATVENVRYYSLWYQLLCEENTCTGLSLLYENENVSGSYSFEIVAVPVCALIATLCGFFGVLLLQILTCDCGRRADCNPKPVVIFSTVMFWIAALFSGLSVFIAIAVCTEFYRNDSIDSAGEFPWCLMMFVLGFLLVVAAAIMYTIIVRNWAVHGMFYGYSGDDWRELEYANNGFYHRNTSFRDRASLRRSFKEGSKVPGFGGVPSFSDSADVRRSDYGKPTYFDFRLGNSKRSSSYTDLKQAKRNIHDSPSVLRHTNAAEFILEERNSLREARKIPRTRSFDDMDPKRLSDYSANGSHPGDKNILDVLYRESRKVI